MTVYIPGPLRSYVGGKSQVEGRGSTLAEVLRDLDARYPGMRFRIIDEQDGIRTHIKIFAGQEQAPNLDVRLDPAGAVHLICALSGG